MRRFTSILIILACLALLPSKQVTAGFFDDDTLVTIDGVRYSADDFKRWWKFWQEPNQSFPKTPDPYIEWLLLAREGKGMQLDEDPGFKRQTRIFLQSRTLLMLKYDAVNSKINVTDAEIQARYEEKYLPRWMVQKLQFKDDAAAQAAWDALAEGSLTVDELLARDPEQGGPASTTENWLRPNGIDPGWADIFRKVNAGDVVNPSEHKGGPSLFYLKDQKGGDEEDLAKFREEIQKDLWKEQEGVLTRALLDELRDKYQVKVDEERLAAMDLGAPDDSFTDAPVITSTMQNVSEKEFMVVIRKLMASRPQAGHAVADEDLARKLKAETVNNIIAQSTTNWESLDRHFEEKEPFKWEYQFNYNHRLVLALETRLFLTEAKATDAEIKQYFDEHIDRFTRPEMVRLYIIDDTQGPVDRIWAEAMTGKDFQQVLRENFEQPVPAQEAPANHLDPAVKAMVDKMAIGETSPVFTAQGIRVVVHLVDRTVATPLPLARVSAKIGSAIKREKVEAAAKAYIEKIKAQSEIEVRNRQWKAIQKELGGA